MGQLQSKKPLTWRIWSRVVGVDMTGEMLARAKESAQAVGRNLGYRNVEFRRGTLERIGISFFYHRDTEDAEQNEFSVISVPLW